MFDASMKTVSEKKKYNKFLKQLKSKGYIMLQKSVYYSFGRSSSLFVAEIKNIKKNTSRISATKEIIPIVLKSFV